MFQLLLGANNNLARTTKNFSLIPSARYFSIFFFSNYFLYRNFRQNRSINHTHSHRHTHIQGRIGKQKSKEQGTGEKKPKPEIQELNRSVNSQQFKVTTVRIW